MKDVRILKNENLLKYSIVVPVYNIEKYIRRCVDSIINQTYENIEIILVDDGSTDNSGIICDEYAKDPRVKVIHKKNQGLGEARNSGLEAATGDYISFFDGDDFIELNLLEVCNNELANNRVDIISFDFIDYDNGTIVKHKNKNKKKYFNKDEIEEYLLDMIYNKNNEKRIHESIWNKLYDLKFLKRIKFNFVSERKYISEDYFSNLILFKYVETIINIPNQLYYYCYNENSLTHVYNPERLEKNIFQYNESVKLCKNNYHKRITNSKLACQFLGNYIGIIRTILNSNLSKREKKKKVFLILDNIDTKKIIKEINPNECNFKQKILIFCLKHNFNFAVLSLFKLKYK